MFTPLPQLLLRPQSPWRSRPPSDLHRAPGVHPRRLICWCSCLHRAAHQDRRGRPCHPVRVCPLRAPHPLRRWHPSRRPCRSCCPRC